MAGLAPPQPRQKVGNRECAYSFDSPYAEGGLFVNLKTFAGCGSDFVKKDAARSQTVLYAHHRWTKVPKEDVEMSEPTTKTTAAAAAAPAAFPLAPGSTTVLRMG